MGNGFSQKLRQNKENCFPRTNSTSIPFEKWIDGECLRFGHLNHVHIEQLLSFEREFFTIIGNRCFKPLERRGDSQFKLCEFGKSDVIVTLPAQLPRYNVAARGFHKERVRLNRVIGADDHFIVFQVWNGYHDVQIFVADLNSGNNIARRIPRRFNCRTYMCLISPDCTLLLLTPDYEDTRSWRASHHGESTILVRMRTFEPVQILPARSDQRFAFDPRFGHTRLAVFDKFKAELFNPVTNQILLCSTLTLTSRVCRIQYTPDGTLLLVLCAFSIDQPTIQNYFISILNSTTLLHMRSIIDYTCPLLSYFHHSPFLNLLFHIYPAISNNGSNIAILTHFHNSNHHHHHHHHLHHHHHHQTNSQQQQQQQQHLKTIQVQVHSLPWLFEPNLKEYCRRAILKSVHYENIDQLPLPKKLVHFVKYGILT